MMLSMKGLYLLNAKRMVPSPHRRFHTNSTWMGETRDGETGGEWEKANLLLEGESVIVHLPSENESTLRPT